VLPHGKTETAGRERYTYYLQQALGCIHPVAYFYTSRAPLADIWSLSTEPNPIPLETDSGPVYLTVAQSFRPRIQKREWRMSTQQYIYNVSATADTHDYLFAWHWHPKLGPVQCHLHVDAKLANDMGLTKKHLPTSRVTFEDVLWFLIDEFDVYPAKELVECQRVLKETRERHEKARHWAGSRKP
jgi:hypothetical protein